MFAYLRQKLSKWFTIFKQEANQMSKQPSLILAHPVYRRHSDVFVALYSC